MKPASIPRVLLILLIAISVLATACGDNGTAPSGADEVENVRVVFPRAKELAGEDVYLHIANELGYAEENGIRFTFESAIGTTDSTKLITTGQGEVAYPSPFVSITARSTGLPIKSVFDTLQWNIFGFGVREDSPLTSVADLEGKKVALGDGGWTIIAAPLLKAHGLTTDDVEWVVAGERRQLAVWEGDVDAVLTWEMEYQNWAAQGIPLRTFGQDAVNFQSNGLVMADSVIEENPDLVRAIARSAAMGAVFMHENIEAAAQIALEAFPGVTPPDFDGMVEVVRALDSLMFYETSEEHGLGYHVEEYWTQEIQDLFDAGVITEMIEATDVTTNEFIDYANDFDHERVRQDARDFEVTWED